MNYQCMPLQMTVDMECQTSPRRNPFKTWTFAARDTYEEWRLPSTSCLFSFLCFSFVHTHIHTHMLSFQKPTNIKVHKRRRKSVACHIFSCVRRSRRFLSSNTQKKLTKLLLRRRAHTSLTMHDVWCDVFVCVRYVFRKKKMRRQSACIRRYVCHSLLLLFPVSIVATTCIFVWCDKKEKKNGIRVK